MRILVIEDEPAIVRTLERGLGAHGYTVVSTDNGEHGIVLATSEPVDVVLLDIALPGLDGHQTLARIRAIRQDLPILMLTARDDLNNKVAALEAGADDYLTKPFALEELVARLRAMTRRADQQRSATIEAGDLTLDLVARRCSRGNERIELSSREFALLEYFMRNSGRLLTRQQILSAIWEYDFDPMSNVVDVYVRYLRRKIDRHERPSLITTVRGSGYRFDPSPDGSKDSGTRPGFDDAHWFLRHGPIQWATAALLRCALKEDRSSGWSTDPRPALRRISPVQLLSAAPSVSLSNMRTNQKIRENVLIYVSVMTE
ncbi:MAG: response regulator transcription factor [Chloroflexia bacterium]|nr:response regulator transcription factor [Chloroflexia bacterium]